MQWGNVAYTALLRGRPLRLLQTVHIAMRYRYWTRLSLYHAYRTSAGPCHGHGGHRCGAQRSWNKDIKYQTTKPSHSSRNFPVRQTKNTKQVRAIQYQMLNVPLAFEETDCSPPGTLPSDTYSDAHSRILVALPQRPHHRIREVRQQRSFEAPTGHT